MSRRHKMNPATSLQLKFLADLGVKDIPATLTVKEASALIHKHLPPKKVAVAPAITAQPPTTDEVAKLWAAIAQLEAKLAKLSPYTPVPVPDSEPIEGPECVFTSDDIPF
jgi:Asp-tRNA(Asn)/Glu-tRNA(Gln) amidotransferase A subunit family amidase